MIWLRDRSYFAHGFFLPQIERVQMKQFCIFPLKEATVPLKEAKTNEHLAKLVENRRNGDYQLCWNNAIWIKLSDLCECARVWNANNRVVAHCSCWSRSQRDHSRPTDINSNKLLNIFNEFPPCAQWPMVCWVDVHLCVRCFFLLIRMRAEHGRYFCTRQRKRNIHA